MSPSAMTAAGRGAAANARPATAPGHRRQVRKPVAPTRPRRVSGPARSRLRTGTRPTPAVLLPRAVELVRSLPDRSLVDRLVRGRAWIPVLGVLLAGIVAMQIEVLKLGTSIGRSIERSSSLQGQNESLQASVATLADSTRIERLAANMGMIMPGPTAVSFLSGSRNANVGAAIANIHAPDQSNFEAQLPPEATPGDSSTQAGASATADVSSSSTSAASVPDASATATGDASAASGDVGSGAGTGATDVVGAGAGAAGEVTGAPTAATGPTTEATGQATEATGNTDATGAAAGTDATGVGTPATGAAAPVAGPPQTSSGAEG